jgi:TIR domain
MRRRRRIFINYRRDDSRADSGRLYDRLLIRFPGQVFRDIGSLEPGVEWREAIARVLSQVDACIVVIGNDWLSIRDASGNRRLDNPDDTVRQEIATAIQHKARIFPVLVGGAKMPDEGDLPFELRPLCRRNAVEITEQDWDEGYRKLVRALEAALELSPEPLPGEARRSAVKKWIVAGAVPLAILIIVVLYNAGTHPPKALDNRANMPSPQTGLVEKQPINDEQREQKVSAPVKPPPRSIPNTVDLTGNWQALVSFQDQQLNEQVDLYRDHSFRVMLQGSPAAVGRWTADPVGNSVQFTDAANLTANGVKFSCRLSAVGGNAKDFSGSCLDQMQNSWAVSINRVSDASPEPAPEIARVNVSVLSMAERVIFAQLLTNRRCTCPCGLTVLVCLEKDQSCPYSPALAQTALAAFLAMTRS